MVLKQRYLTRLLASFFLTAYCVSAIEINLANEWKNYKKNYNKVYAPGEEEKRHLTFVENVRFIIKHNTEADMGMHSYRLGLTPLTDLSHEEYLQMLGSVVDVAELEDIPVASFEHVSLPELPDSLDYRKKGMVTKVKNQGQCGSCYTFSSTGSLEGIWKKGKGKLISLSEQQLLDCSEAEGNNGCNGGNQENTFKYIMKAGGVENEKSYPYHEKKEKCNFKKGNVVAKISGYEKVPQKEDDLLKAVATVGTIAATCNGMFPTFQHYKSGVYDDPSCKDKLNHAVTLVGYGKESNKPYWLLKNQWSTNWGEKGYMKMVRNKNLCGIAEFNLYPKL